MTRISYLDTARGLLTRRDPKEFLFFTRTPNGRGAAKEFLARLEERTNDRDKAISVRSFRAQLKAIHRWGQQEPAELASIHQPVLVMNGESDKMVPTKNTVDLDRRLPNSQLVIYPDAGHGGVFQFHEDFVKRALEFLGEAEKAMKAIRRREVRQGRSPRRRRARARRRRPVTYWSR